MRAKHPTKSTLVIQWRAASGVVIACLTYAFFCSPAWSAWETNGSLRLDSTYNDNVTLATQNRDDSVINVVGGEAEVRQVTERSNVSAIAGANYLQYVDPHANGNDLNDRDIEYGDLRASFRGERTTWGVNGSIRRDVLLETVGFIRSPIPDGGTQGGDTTSGGNGSDTGTPDSDVGVDAGSVDRQVRRLDGAVAPFLNYQITERVSAQFGYNYRVLDYHRGSDVGLENSQTNGVTAGLSRAMSERDTVRISMSGARFDPESDSKTDSYGITAGWDRQFSPRAGMRLNVGTSLTEQDGESQTGLLVQVRGFRNSEVGGLFIQAQRSLYPSGLGFVETDRLTFGFERVLSDTVRMSLMGDAYKTNDADNTSGDIDNARKYISVGPEIAWSLTPNYSIGMRYHFNWADRQGQPGNDAYSNAVGIFISYRPQREF